MSNKLLKICSFILLAIIMSLVAISPISAAYLDPKSIIPNDYSGTAKTTQTIAGQILAVVQVIGVSVAIIMLLILAIKYLSAAPNDKAEIKKHAVVYVVGAVVLFGASGILEIIKGFAGKIG